QYDFSALFAEHPSDMIGFYIRALEKPDMSPVEKKALFYGIHALLLTTDERS
ncbi:MAG: metallophosphoesterase, partial [Firmicutes bacterium]|nr:metallophosphoesterase [Bacillota bacterium]